MLWGRREMFEGYAVCSWGLAKHLLDWAGVHTGRSAAAETMAAAVAAAEVVAAEAVAAEAAVVEVAAVAVVAVAAEAELDQSASAVGAEVAAAWSGWEPIAVWAWVVGNSCWSTTRCAATGRSVKREC